jgi:hypothetical protein
MSNEIIETVETNIVQDNVLKDAENRGALFKMAINQLAKATRPSNWTDHSGKPYLDDNGCEAIARIAGISIDEPKVSAGYEEDITTGERFYAVEMTGAACAIINGTEIRMPQVGGCSSRDKFFKSGDKIKANITTLDIKKKAYANYRGRCIRSFLSLGSLSWDDLKELGIDKGGCTSVEYRTGKTTGKSDDGNEARQKLRDMILDDCKGNAAAAGELLEALTTFEGKDGKQVTGKSNVKDLSDKQAGYSWGKYKPEGSQRKDYELFLSQILSQYGIEA